MLRRRDQQLLRLAQRGRPDLVLLLKGDTFSEAVLVEIKRLVRGPLVTWWVDDPWRAPAFLSTLRLFDHVFVFDRSYLPRLTDVGVKRVHFLPCACDETVYRPQRLSASEQRRMASDVAFVAWYYPERVPVVRALANDMAVGVWGGGWDSIEAQQALQGRRVLRGHAVSDRTAAKIYMACKIGLNMHQVQSHVGGLNTRTFEILASGRFQLVDRLPGIEELLMPDVEVVCFSSLDELRQLAKHYLADEAARTRIADRGRARVLDEHTYVRRLRTLCETARVST